MKDQFLFQETNPSFPKQEHLNCPRCDSSNTKFCYYNNYNLSQPRHYCKNCKRYWTKGGVLRNIPIGGGSRKNTKRSSSTRKDSSSTSTIASSSSSTPTTTPTTSSSITAIETESSCSLKMGCDQECKSKMVDLNGGKFGAILGSFDEEVRNVDEDSSNSTSSRCWSRGNWPDLAM